MMADNDEPYPSLSDYHDYEPNLEFDDSELQHTVNLPQAVDLLSLEPNGGTSPISVFSDENFEEELAEACEEASDQFISLSYPAVDDAAPSRFNDIARYGIVDVKGEDSEGRKIIVVYGCRLPPIGQIDHTLFLSYLTHTLDKFVEQDYSLVYFHYGLSSKNKPSIRWLVQAYKAFDRKYKKNLKALYLVHPTNFLKIISQIFRPLISAKFGKKINYINTLKDLNELIPLKKLDIPEAIFEYDRKIGGGEAPSTHSSSQAISPKQQFGVTLQFIKDNYNVTIPPIVKQCVEYLDQPDALETEGIFRRSASAARIKTLKEIADQGLQLVFNDPHEPAVLLKTFLRELKEPLLTFEHYDEVIKFQSWSKEDQLRHVSILMMEKLPSLNYEVLKYIISFLSRVMERAEWNKMNAQNLAVVFGPNLIWSENESMSLGAIGPINMFTQFLLQHSSDIFIV